VNAQRIPLDSSYRFGGQFILPAALVTYGVVATYSKKLLSFDKQIKEEIWTDHPHQALHFDNYLQYVPGLSVYGLNAIGIKGKNSFWTASKRYFIAELIMSVVVQSTKMITQIRRPDGMGTNAFPSGHTATAFVGAEFLNQEYRDRSRWYGIAGYILAAGVGYMRVYNNRHWFRDVVAGAGVGISTTKLVYGLAEKHQRNKNRKAEMIY
jgi:membrane-associated phospholipid phosphatase